MLINQDKVPINLDDAVNILIQGLVDDDIKFLKDPNFNPSQLHFSLGMALRNEWSLWEKDTILVTWFKTNLGIEHADDISSIILDAVWRDVLRKPRRTKALARKYIKHWEKQKNKE